MWRSTTHGGKFAVLPGLEYVAGVASPSGGESRQQFMEPAIAYCSGLSFRQASSIRALAHQLKANSEPKSSFIGSLLSCRLAHHFNAISEYRFEILAVADYLASYPSSVVEGTVSAGQCHFRPTNSTKSQF